MNIESNVEITSGLVTAKSTKSTTSTIQTELILATRADRFQNKLTDALNKIDWEQVLDIKYAFNDGTGIRYSALIIYKE